MNALWVQALKKLTAEQCMRAAAESDAAGACRCKHCVISKRAAVRVLAEGLSDAEGA